MKRICDIQGHVDGAYTKEYHTWSSMFLRCYNVLKLKRSPTYIGCSIDQRWQRLSQFKLWFDENYVDGYHLDKDLLVQGNKVYGPDTCCFIPPEINQLLAHRHSTNKTGYAGVRLDNITGKYKAQVRKFGKCHHLGYFDCPKQAHAAYVIAKTTYARQVADDQLLAGRITQEIRDAIYRYDFSK